MLPIIIQWKSKGCFKQIESVEVTYVDGTPYTAAAPPLLEVYFYQTLAYVNICITALFLCIERRIKVCIELVLNDNIA